MPSAEISALARPNGRSGIELVPCIEFSPPPSRALTSVCHVGIVRFTRHTQNSTLTSRVAPYVKNGSLSLFARSFSMRTFPLSERLVFQFVFCTLRARFVPNCCVIEKISDNPCGIRREMESAWHFWLLSRACAAK
jgi:hypothetical protein